MKFSKYTQFALAACGGFTVALGFVLVTDSEYDPRYNMGNLIQASATIGAAVVVAALIQKKTQVHFKQKELLVGQLEIVGERLDALALQDFTEGKEYPSVVNDLKRISVILGVVQKAGKQLEFSPQVSTALDFTEDIKRIRKLATDTDDLRQIVAKVNQKSRSVVQNNILRLNKERAEDIVLEVTAMRDRVFFAQIAILAA